VLRAGGWSPGKGRHNPKQGLGGVISGRVGVPGTRAWTVTNRALSSRGSKSRTQPPPPGAAGHPPTHTTDPRIAEGTFLAVSGLVRHPSPTFDNFKMTPPTETLGATPRLWGGTEGRGQRKLLLPFGAPPPAGLLGLLTLPGH
jgi:hypothetical protein